MMKTKKEVKLPKLTSKEKYWDQVDQQTHHLVADLLNQILPLPNLRDKKNLDLEKDADYQELSFAWENNYSGREADLPNSILAEEIAYEYLLLVVKSMLQKLSEFSCHLDFDNLTN